MPAYFGCVLGMTVLCVAVTAWLRPTFALDLATWSGLRKPPQSTPESFYTYRVAPLFEARCNNCHGASRQKGKLRLNSFAGLMRGGKSGPVIEPGSAEHSELFKRIILPPDDDKAMPPKGAESFSEDDITVVKLWIEAGASGSLATDAIKGAPEPVLEVTFPEIDMDAVVEQRAPLAPTVKQLQERFPGVLSYESRGSENIVANASLLGASFGDTELAALAPLGKVVVRLDASRTLVTDASIRALPETMTGLRVLHLAGTKLTDAGVEALISLPALEVLNVSDTPVTNEALGPLRAKGVIVYANDTE